MDKFLSRLNPLNMRYLFYMVTPNETIFATQEDVPNYNDLVSVWFLILILLEYFFIDDRKYAFNDTVTSINAGVCSLVFKFSGRYLSAYFYKSVYDRIHIIDLPDDSVYTWILCFFTQDLCYYMGHRAIHEAGVFWSFHQMHHSSQYYNLSTALRQGAIQDIGMATFDWTQALLIPPNIFTVHRYLNVLYQFWLHTEMVPYLGPLEYFFNTPSSHRVHHGRNPYCIDRNYGGTLIIWDRLFGTYVQEKPTEEIAYGLVTPVNTFDQFYCQFFEFKALGWDKARMKDENGKEIFPTFWDKVKATFGPPGYFPGVQTKPFYWWRTMVDNTEGIPEIESPIQVHNPPLNYNLKVYLMIQWIISLITGLHFNDIRANLDHFEFTLWVLFLALSMEALGFYFDQRKEAKALDILRLVALIVYSYYYGTLHISAYGLASIVAVFVL